MLPLILAAASAAASAYGASKSSKAQAKAADTAAKLFGSIKIPSLEQARAELQQYVQQGQITPQMAEFALQQASAYSQIQEDPRLRGSQMDALSAYEAMANNGGLDAQANADLYNARNEMQTANRGAQDAIMANARARGQGGSDLEFVNRLIAQQGAAGRGMAAGVQAAADATRRRDAALGAVADLSGKLRAQDYQVASDEAAARDAINRFNTQNRMDTNKFNVTAANNAQATNLAAKQAVADANVQQSNVLAKQLRDEQYRKKAGMAGMIVDAGAAQGKADAATAEGIGNAAKLFGNAVQSYYGQKKDDPNA